MTWGKIYYPNVVICSMTTRVQCPSNVRLPSLPIRSFMCVCVVNVVIIRVPPLFVPRLSLRLSRFSLGGDVPESLVHHKVKTDFLLLLPSNLFYSFYFQPFFLQGLLLLFCTVPGLFISWILNSPFFFFCSSGHRTRSFTGPYYNSSVCH